MSQTAFHGLLVIDKPAGLTSRAVVDRMQRWFPRGTKIGHTGTLDPLATGVLVVCVGAATRLTEYVQRMGKVYRAGILLGSCSDTDDAEGTITPVADATPPDRVAVAQCLSGFVGKTEQRPPAFSAAKVSGRRAYDMARGGKEVALQPRRIQIDRIDLLAYTYPHLEIEVHCGKGTYIRALARDLGERLGCGGLIQSLRRTRVGNFTAESAVSLDTDAATAQVNLQPLSAAVEGLARAVLDDQALDHLRHGRPVALAHAVSNASEEVAVFNERDELIALARMDSENGLLRPEKIIVK